MADVLPVGGKEPDRLAPGTRLGRYELLVPVARGGMARVWAARQHGQRGFTKIVAVKTILPHLRKDAQFERMFQNEARIASFVQHPNVCQILELGEDAEILFMAMEWINGDSLARALKASGRVVAMDHRIVARIISDACAGLHSAHVQTDELGRPLNIVHRDISPHNIMFTADGNVKVCDFGVAKALNQIQDATLAGQIKGKVSYMPPEQFMGAQLDARADVFAMGVVLYEATTGRQPFEGENDLIIMQRLARGEYTHPSLIAPGYPRELEAIIVRAMQPEPVHRFPNAEQMRIALEEWLARSGPIVTQTNVAQAARERIGGLMEARRNQIQLVSQGQDPNQPIAEMPGLAGHTPSNLQANAPQVSGLGGSPKSGVMPRGPGVSTPRPPPLNATMPLPPGMMPPLPPPRSPPLPQASIPPISSSQTPWWDQARDPLAPPSSMSPSISPSMTPASSQQPQFSAPPVQGFENLQPPSVAKQSSGASYYAVAIGLGVFFAAVIGAAGYFAWARSHRASEPVVIASSPSASAHIPSIAVSALPIAPAPSAPATASASSSAPHDTIEIADEQNTKGPAAAPTSTAAATPATTTTAPPETTATATAVPAWTAAPVATAQPRATATATATASPPTNTTSQPVATAPAQTSATPQATATATATSKPAASATSVKPTKPSALPDNPY